MTRIKNILLCAFTLTTLAGAAHAADPAPLSRAQMNCIRGEKAFSPGHRIIFCPEGSDARCRPGREHVRPLPPMLAR